MTRRQNRNAKPPAPARPSTVNRTAKQPVHFGVDVNGDNVRWIAQSTLWLYAMASNPLETTTNRVMAHAMLRMDYHGVAVFKRSELARLCARVDRATGVLKPLTADTLNRALQRLKSETGFLLGESWSQVLYVNHLAAQNGTGQADAPLALPRKPGFDGRQAAPFGEVEP